MVLARWLPLVLVAACAPPAGTTATPPTSPPAPASEVCPQAIDVAELLRRHGEIYGTEHDIEDLLPFTLSGGGGSHPRTFVARDVDSRVMLVPLESDPPRFRPPHDASGIDEKGPWALVAGTRLPLLTDEAQEPLFESWFVRRRYLSAFKPARDHASCVVVDGQAHVQIAYAMPEVGSPTMVFRAKTAELHEVTHARAVGGVARRRIGSWTHLGEVMFPSDVVDEGVFGGIESSFRLVGFARGSCDTCISEPKSRTELTLGRSVVVPFHLVMGQIIARGKIGSTDARVLLDTGAGMMTFDPHTTAPFESWASGFISTVTKKEKVELGEVASVSLGEVTVSRAPAVRIPLPILANLGSWRPDLIIGVPLFMTGPVRIDYARNQIVLGALAEEHAGQVAIPLHVRGSQLVIDATVADQGGSFVVDTGSANPLTLNERWATAHGLPSGKSEPIAGRFEAGAGGNTSFRLFRIARTSLGAVVMDDLLAGETTLAPAFVERAGIIGNGALGRCQAIVVDVPARKLWLEGPCDRPVREQKGGFQYRRSDALEQWVITAVDRDGPAWRAGLRPGDWLVSVDGTTFPFEDLDVDIVDEKLSQPAGTHVRVVVKRVDLGTTSTHDLVLARRL